LNYVTRISFNGRFTSVPENGGVATIKLTVENPSAGATADLVFQNRYFQYGHRQRCELTQQTTTSIWAWARISKFKSRQWTMPEEEQDEYFVLALENATGVTVQGNPYFTVYIRDNDRKAPAATKAVELELCRPLFGGQPGLMPGGWPKLWPTIPLRNACLRSARD
jgi:hypothetical protein